MPQTHQKLFGDKRNSCGWAKDKRVALANAQSLRWSVVRFVLSFIISSGWKSIYSETRTKQKKIMCPLWGSATIDQIVCTRVHPPECEQIVYWAAHRFGIHLTLCVMLLFDCKATAALINLSLSLVANTHNTHKREWTTPTVKTLRLLHCGLWYRSVDIEIIYVRLTCAMQRYMNPYLHKR